MNIVITGATKGIGKAIAQRFAKEGFNLAICSRNTDDLVTFKAELLATYPQINVLTVATDVSKKSAILNFAAQITAQWDRIDVLINNAGVFLPGTIHDEADGSLEQQIDTNLYSAYHLTRALLPVMIPHQSGHIFNMCSIASLFAYPHGGSYSISKFALLGFSKVLREEMKEKGIKVTSILPGATWSHSWKDADIPKDRIMPAADIANTIWGAYQLSDVGVVEELVIRPQLGDL